jgi:hypothetical protein
MFVLNQWEEFYQGLPAEFRESQEALRMSIVPSSQGESR